MGIEEQARTSLLPQARSEPSVTSDVEWKLYAHIKCPTTGVDFKQELARLVESELVGIGRVEVVMLKIVFMATAGGQSIYAGVCHPASTASAEALGGMQGGLAFTSTSFNYGVKENVELIIPGTCSRQIQPISSAALTPKLKLKADAKMNVWVDLYLTWDGPMTKQMDLPSF